MVLDPDQFVPPRPDSIVFEAQIEGHSTARGFDLIAYIRGHGGRSWKDDHAAIYTTHSEALKDAEGRIARWVGKKRSNRRSRSR